MLKLNNNTIIEFRNSRKSYPIWMKRKPTEIEERNIFILVPDLEKSPFKSQNWCLKGFTMPIDR